MPSAITEYASAIQSGQIPACKRLKKLYLRLAERICQQNGHYVFDQSKAQRPIKFIEQFCRHSKGEWAGQQIKLELFQKAYIEGLFGFVDADNGLRQYNESLLFMARKNGKSTLLSALALYCLLADNEAGAEIYCAATKKDQAKIVFDEIWRMVLQDHDLSQYIRKRKSDLYCEKLFAKIQALGRNTDTLDGLNAHLIVIDELHSIRDRNMYEVLKQSQSARRQPLLVMISTAGTVRECIFDDVYRYACGVVDGDVKDDHFLPVLYELDNKLDWKDPNCWIKSNPSLGHIKKVEDLQQKVARAKQSPQDMTGILCKDFNLLSTSSTAWLSYDDIDNAQTFDLKSLQGSFFIGGADLSISTDLTCATALMIDKQEHIYVTQMYWLPEGTYQQHIQEKIPYDKWHEQGLLRLCKGNSIRYSDVTNWFLELVNNYGLNPAWIYYDSYSARYWIDEMQNYGFRMDRCIQGAKTLSGPMYQLGADLKAKKINYNNNPILKWCICNTGVQQDRNGNIVPVKAQGAKYRIDGLASLLNAYVGLCDHLQEMKDTAIYEGIDTDEKLSKRQKM